MLTTFKARLLLVLALFLTSALMAQETPDAGDQGKYINVTIELHGLEESARVLNRAALELAERLNQIDPDVEQMTPQQLQALALVIEQANHLIQTSDEGIKQAGAAIEGLVSDTLTAVQQSAIEPTIESVDASVTRWLAIIFSALFLIVAAAGYFIFLSTRQIRAVAKTLKSITEDYEIVPKRVRQESIVSGEEDSISR